MATKRPVVLIVDDIGDVRLAFRLLLESAKFRVLEAADAYAALRCLRKEKVDLVLTDLYMPGELDGIGLVDIIRNKVSAELPVIAMSGSPHLAYRSSLQAAQFVGANATLTKTVRADVLFGTINSLLEARPA